MSQAGRSCQGRDGRVVEYPEAQMGILAREWSGRRERGGGPRAARARNEMKEHCVSSPGDVKCRCWVKRRARGNGWAGEEQ
jgi:hypothetical protein